MEKLFLIKPGFGDPRRNSAKHYFCPPCTMLEGVLSFYPELREKLDVIYVDFERPRQAIVDLIGEEHQSCPVLILEDGTFINDPDFITDHLAKKYGVPYAH